VGINLAVQDAVAAANRLYPAFTRGVPAIADLRAVQQRRVFPMKVIQTMQVIVQRRLIQRILTSNTKMKPPFLIRVLAAVPLLRRFPAYLIGIGPRPEHIGTPQRR
jgi:2-polyprenyl-6-methoxyphenol hydroxylase-like FAD-dependent oxidoreductase